MNQLFLFEFEDLIQDELDRLHPNPRPLSKRVPRRLQEPANLELLFTYDDVEELPKRPTFRRECVDGPRPCPWVSCRFHLFLDHNEDNDTLKFNFPGMEPWEIEHSCALDVVDAGKGDPLHLADLGSLLNVGPERARQLVNEAMASAREVAQIFGLEDLFQGGEE